MKQTERAAIMRITTDLVEADGIIDTREIAFLDDLREKYGIQKEDEVKAASVSLASALAILAESDKSLRHDLLGDFMGMAMSDDFCAREEALLILALRNCLADNDGSVKVVSIKAAGFNFEESQILYVENEYDKEINNQICDNYREICNEIRLSGFDFVYLPKIAEHYSSIPKDCLFQITEFLYPKVSSARLAAIINQLRTLSTDKFCKEQLSAKLGFKEMDTIEPSLMLKIGDSIVDDKPITNFLIIGISDDVLDCIRHHLDVFSKAFRTERLNYLQEEKGRFVFKGFYKQVFDIFMLRKGIQSSVLIDTFNERIFLPEADTAIEKIHRREKALYALFLLEASKGGINFNKPESPKQMERYKKRMASVQKKYCKIYHMFGGDPNTAPNLEVPEIRLPMISLLKRQIKKLDDVLYQADDYIVQRNGFGNYNVGVKTKMVYCTTPQNEVARLSESDVWKQIAKL